jgi:hypothetical protein
MCVIHMHKASVDDSHSVSQIQLSDVFEHNSLSHGAHGAAMSRRESTGGGIAHASSGVLMGDIELALFVFGHGVYLCLLG